MSAQPPLTEHQFFSELFASKAVREGAVIRRKVRDVERHVGRQGFLDEMRRRGFPVVENAGQFIVFFNCDPIRQLV